jgi:hypothetical protein
MGGWWCDPPHWKRNTALTLMLAGGIGASLFSWSSARESVVDTRNMTIRFSKLDDRWKWAQKEERQRRQQQYKFVKGDLGRSPTLEE